MTNQINATAPTPQDWIDLVRENETLRQKLESKMTEQRKTVHEPYFKAIRENLEKIAKKAQGVFVEVETEWAHSIPPNGIYCTVNHNEVFVNCYLIGRDDMGAFVYRIDGDYHSTMDETNFKSIKPTISKAQAWDMLVSGMESDDIRDNHTITD